MLNNNNKMSASSSLKRSAGNGKPDDGSTETATCEPATQTRKIDNTAGAGVTTQEEVSKSQTGQAASYRFDASSSSYGGKVSIREDFSTATGPKLLNGSSSSSASSGPNFIHLKRGLTAVPVYSSMNREFARDKLERAKLKLLTEKVAASGSGSSAASCGASSSASGWVLDVSKERRTTASVPVSTKSSKASMVSKSAPAVERSGL
ncbi:unnamed protein product, partial [Amoebophrya sp. A25]|eukprot:GSA25T00021424001.1